MNPVYAFTAEERKNPPTWWCLPTINTLVMEQEAHWGNKSAKPLIVPSECRHTDDCQVAPETLRKNADEFLRSKGVLPAGWPELPLDVYTLARNVRSEFGSGWPMEKVAIIWAGINRTVEDKSASITAHLLGSKGNYGKQIGQKRPASTAQDPTVADIMTAWLIYSNWKSGSGLLPDPTHGATHYFDKVSQDGMAAKRKKQRETDTTLPVVLNGLEVYRSWTHGGDYLTWAGFVPNVRTVQLLLLRRRRELKTNQDERDKIRDYGEKALIGQNRTPPPHATCGPRMLVGPGAAVAKTLVGTAAEALPWMAFAGMVTLGLSLGVLYGKEPT